LIGAKKKVDRVAIYENKNQIKSKIEIKC
jgi:hypothetical protein